MIKNLLLILFLFFTITLSEEVYYDFETFSLSVELNTCYSYSENSYFQITKENEKYVFNNCMFKIENKTMQVDHILVSNKGVIVIETKNYFNR